MRIDINFRDIPTYRASWAPIYFEPIMGSGERFTVGVLLADEEGIALKRTINDAVIKALFGSRFHHISQMIEFIFDGLSQLKLDTSQPVKLPLSGFFVGAWNVASSRSYREGVFKQASYQSAALAKMSESGLIEKDQTAIANRRFGLEVRNHVIKIRPDLSDNFNAVIQLVPDGVPPKLGFLHSGNAANFGRLRTNSLNDSFKSLRSKIHELHQAKKWGKINRGYLIVSRSGAYDGDIIQELPDTDRAIKQLNHEASGDEIKFIVSESIDEASELVRKLAA